MTLINAIDVEFSCFTSLPIWHHSFVTEKQTLGMPVRRVDESQVATARLQRLRREVPGVVAVLPSL